MDALTFARGLLDRGIEVTLRGNRLHVWPAKAYRHLTDAEKQFISDHRAELKDVAASKVLPETTVVWDPNAPSTSTPPPEPPQPECEFCGSTLSRCEERKDTDNYIWRILHSRDPDVIRQRDAAATKQMMDMVGRSNR